MLSGPKMKSALNASFQESPTCSSTMSTGRSSSGLIGLFSGSLLTPVSESKVGGILHVKWYWMTISATGHLSHILPVGNWPLIVLTPPKPFRIVKSCQNLIKISVGIKFSRTISIPFVRSLTMSE